MVRRVIAQPMDRLIDHPRNGLMVCPSPSGQALSAAHQTVVVWMPLHVASHILIAIGRDFPANAATYLPRLSPTDSRLQDNTRLEFIKLQVGSVANLRLSQISSKNIHILHHINHH